MDTEKAFFNRTSLLVGDDIMEIIAQKRVIIFGLGGVGSWCAESLIRSGIRNLVLVDSDRVCVTNVNRQLMATTKTIGKVKVEALKERLLEINPHAEITANQDIYEEANTAKFHLETFDYIIDAIDSLENKMQLLIHACNTKAKVYSSMGAALKINPTHIKTAEFWDVKGCPLARALRDKLKKRKIRLRQKVQCVYSDELLKNRGKNQSCEILENTFPKAQINGTMVHITAIFGFMIAGFVMNDIYTKFLKQ